MFLPLSPGQVENNPEQAGACCTDMHAKHLSAHLRASCLGHACTVGSARRKDTRKPKASRGIRLDRFWHSIYVSVSEAHVVLRY